MGAGDNGAGATEEQIKCMLDRSASNKIFNRWLSCGNTLVGIKMNWISSLLALVVLWTFAITCIADDNAAKYYREGRGWVTTNFTWLYIGECCSPLAL